jgi:hypothetical protein
MYNAQFQFHGDQNASDRGNSKQIGVACRPARVLPSPFASFLTTATSLYPHSALPSYLKTALTCCIAVQVVLRSQLKLSLCVPLAPIEPKETRISIPNYIHRVIMRISSLSLPLVLSLAGYATAYPYSGSEVILRRQSDKQAKADAVKEAFQHAWNGYVKYAFPHDELHPVSNGYGDSR